MILDNTPSAQREERERSISPSEVAEVAADPSFREEWREQFEALATNISSTRDSLGKTLDEVFQRGQETMKQISEKIQTLPYQALTALLLAASAGESHALTPGGGRFVMENGKEVWQNTPNLPPVSPGIVEQVTNHLGTNATVYMTTAVSLALLMVFRKRIGAGIKASWKKTKKTFEERPRSENVPWLKYKRNTATVVGGAAALSGATSGVLGSIVGEGLTATGYGALYATPYVLPFLSGYQRYQYGQEMGNEHALASIAGAIITTMRSSTLAALGGSAGMIFGGPTGYLAGGAAGYAVDAFLIQPFINRRIQKKGEKRKEVWKKNSTPPNAIMGILTEIEDDNRQKKEQKETEDQETRGILRVLNDNLLQVQQAKGVLDQKQSELEQEIDDTIDTIFADPERLETSYPQRDQMIERIAAYNAALSQAAPTRRAFRSPSPDNAVQREAEKRGIMALLRKHERKKNRDKRKESEEQEVERLRDTLLTSEELASSRDTFPICDTCENLVAAMTRLKGDVEQKKEEREAKDRLLQEDEQLINSVQLILDTQIAEENKRENERDNDPLDTGERLISGPIRAITTKAVSAFSRVRGLGFLASAAKEEHVETTAATEENIRELTTLLNKKIQAASANENLSSRYRKTLDMYLTWNERRKKPKDLDVIQKFDTAYDAYISNSENTT